MNPQDLAALVWAVFLTGTVVWGTTGPRHLSTHVLLIGTALFTPLISFDLSRLRELPVEAWAIAAAMLGVQLTHTLFHVRYPSAPHSRGPEILCQSMICLWAVSFAQRLDPSLWYRGQLGRFLFSMELVFVSFAVMVYIYVSEMTARPDDAIDFKQNTFRSRSNAAFLAASNAGLMVTLYATTSHPGWLGGALAAFVATRLLVPMADTDTAR